MHAHTHPRRCLHVSASTTAKNCAPSAPSPVPEASSSALATTTTTTKTQGQPVPELVKAPPQVSPTPQEEPSRPSRGSSSSSSSDSSKKFPAGPATAQSVPHAWLEQHSIGSTSLPRAVSEAATPKPSPQSRSLLYSSRSSIPSMRPPLHPALIPEMHMSHSDLQGQDRFQQVVEGNQWRAL